MQDATRRAVLATTGTTIAAALAGCASGGEATTDDAGETTTRTAEPTTTETESTTAESTTQSGTATESTTQSGTATEPTTVVVAPEGELRFAPDAVTVAVGDVVEWEWAAGGHNVVVDEQPADADWTGTDGDGSTTYDAGHTHRHAFDVPGTYSYYCSPHQGVGMTGAVVVE